MTYWQRPEFRRLQEWWYSRLETNGFNDAEEMIGGDLVLKQSSDYAYKHADELVVETKTRYFSLLRQKTFEAEFKSEVDEIILTKFAEGEKIKNIVDVLAERGSSRARNTVRFTIRKYEQHWGLRQYTPRQLNKKESA